MLLSLEILSRLGLNPGSVQAVHGTAAARKALIAECEKASEMPELAGYKPEAEALREAMIHTLEGDEARIVAFEDSLAPLKKALDVHTDVKRALEASRRAYAAGSLDRRDVLKLRDDADYLASVAQIRARELAEATADTGSLIGGGVPAGVPSVVREFVHSFTSAAENRANHPEQAWAREIRDLWTDDARSRFLDISDEEFRYVPIAASAALEVHGHASGPLSTKAKRAVFLDFLNQYKPARMAHIRAKIAKAQTALSAAQKNSAALSEAAQ